MTFLFLQNFIYNTLETEKGEDSKTRIYTVHPIPSELAEFSYQWFDFKVKSLKGRLGEFNPANQTLTVKPAALEDGSTILHELIHLHEFVIDGLPMFYHDMVYWALYKDLKKKIPRLDNLITDHAHMLTGASIYSRGGLHDILFLLKSLELDIRMGYPLGKVFGYGLAEELESFFNQKDTER